MSSIVAEVRYVFRSLNKSRTYTAAFVALPSASVSG